MLGAALALLMIPTLAVARSSPAAPQPQVVAPPAQEASPSPAQEAPPANPATGNIVGKVTDEAGVPLRSAVISIRDRAAQVAFAIRTDASGQYTTEPMPPGVYTVTVSAVNYVTTEFRVGVQAGASSRGDVKLMSISPGAARALSTPESLSGTLPLNGHNFLDLTQLAPGVEALDAGAADSRKAGFFGVSLDSRTGRNTQLDLDGIRINDETQGMTTQNVAAAGIQEFAVNRAVQEPSAPLAASGRVALTTGSGSNDLHGAGFYNLRDSGIAFAGAPGGRSPSWRRNQLGGALGGALQPDKTFFFLSGEHTRDNGDASLNLPFPFNQLPSTYSAPYRDSSGLGRLDYHLSPASHLFYRFAYDSNTDVWSNRGSSLLRTANTSPAHAVGLDFTRGSYVHSVRFGYSRYSNSTLPSAALSSSMGLPSGVDIDFAGPRAVQGVFAPQSLRQSSLEGRYDGSRSWGVHGLRFGGAVSRIVSGGSVAHGAFGPTVFTTPALSSVESILGNPSAPFAALIPGDPAGAADNPLNYPVNRISIFNGQAFSSPQSALGFSGGGFFDTRLSAYVSDSWKWRPNVVITAGLSYVRDSGRTNGDLASVTCSQVNAAFVSAAPCTGSSLLLDQFGNIAGLGKPVGTPNTNFAPQLGIAWDPGHNGRTVLRAGAGMFFENNLVSNLWADRRVRLSQGQLFSQADLCPSGSVRMPDGTLVSSIDGLDIASQICGQPVGSVTAAISDLQAAYQAASTAAGTAFNPSFLGNTLSGNGSLAPGYKTPRVVQITAGFQRELRRGEVLSFDFVRNVGTHHLLGVDTNRVGDSRYISVDSAIAAINATLAGNPLTSGVCAPADSAGSSSETAVNCYLAHVPGANIADFARNGLDSAAAFCGGFACSVLGKAAAFSGINPAVGSNVMYFPVGRSVYNGVQIGYKTSTEQPFRYARRLDLALAYTYSRYKDTGGVGNSGLSQDMDVLSRAQDFINPLRYFGPSGLDRTHRITVAPVFELGHGFLVSAISHFDSPLASTLYIPQTGGGGVPGEIFRSDATGDGTVGDVLPGTRRGQFGRGIQGSGLARAINGYDTLFGNQITPAGGQLLSSNLFTAEQLVLLGAVTPLVQSSPQGAVGPGWSRTVDLRLAFPIHVGEILTIEPRVSAFNVFNFANFGGPGEEISGILDAAPGLAANNSTRSCGVTPNFCTARSNRVGQGSGVFSQGAPRQVEFGVRVTF